MLSAHCIGLKYALAMSKAVDASPFAVVLVKGRSDVIGYESNSNKRKEHRMKLQEVLGLGTLRLLGLHLVRWLSRGRVLPRLCRLYAALALEFEEDAAKGSPSAKALLTLMLTHRFAASLFGMTDIVSRCHLLSLLFQTKDIEYASTKHRPSTNACMSH